MPVHDRSSAARDQGEVDRHRRAQHCASEELEGRGLELTHVGPGVEGGVADEEQVAVGGRRRVRAMGVVLLERLEQGVGVLPCGDGRGEVHYDLRAGPRNTERNGRIEQGLGDLLQADHIHVLRNTQRRNLLNSLARCLCPDCAVVDVPTQIYRHTSTISLGFRMVNTCCHI